MHTFCMLVAIWLSFGRNLSKFVVVIVVHLKKKHILSVFPFLFISKIEPNTKSTLMFVGEGENHGNVTQMEIRICSFIKQIFF